MYPRCHRSSALTRSRQRAQQAGLSTTMFHLATLRLHPGDLERHELRCLPQGLHLVLAVLQAAAPQVLEDVAHVEVVVLGDRDALDAAGMAVVVLRLLDR